MSHDEGYYSSRRCIIASIKKALTVTYESNANLNHRNLYRCKDCTKTFQEPLPMLDEKHLMTRRLREYVEKEFLKRPFKNLSEELGLVHRTKDLYNMCNLDITERDKKYYTEHIVSEESGT